jgi:hypothetical protein
MTPIPVRFQEAFLSERLCQVHVAQRRQQKPEDLRPVTLHDPGKFLRSNVFRRVRG